MQRDKHSIYKMDKKRTLVIILVLVVYAISSTASYAFFSQNTNINKKLVSPLPKSLKNSSGELVFNEESPNTEVCPISGIFYSKEQKDWWDKHRPLAVMIENHKESRPQSGLSSADVIYEIVAEGGITRFLSIFYCKDVNPIGPVRSARVYFLDFVSEYNFPLYAHVGGANTPGPADALEKIITYGWGGSNDLNQFSIGFPTFWRDYDRLGSSTATEHTMYSSTTKLWEFAKKSRGLTNLDKKGDEWSDSFIPYTFKDDIDISKRPIMQDIHLEFWKGYTDFFVDWKYDSKANNYIRRNGGVAHIDKNTGKTLTAKNIVVLSMIETNANDGYEDNLHLLYKTKGNGKATIFMDGKQIDGVWKKDTRISRTLLFDNEGSAIKFNRGNIWFQVLPTSGIMTVK